MELSWESSKNFSKYKCSIRNSVTRSVPKEVNLLFIEKIFELKIIAPFSLPFIDFTYFEKNESVAGKI